MRTTLRRMLVGLVALPMVVRAGDEPPDLTKTLLGSWFVTSGTMSIVFSLESGGRALVLFVEQGNCSIGRHLWRSLPGGALIDTMPRFRLWEASGPCDARVEMEALPPGLEVSEGLKHFPLRFCMKRVTHASLPKELLARPLPKAWGNATVDEEWDRKEGEKR